MTVQVHEIYASIWSNEKVTFQLIDILSTINPTYLGRINEIWNNQRMTYIKRFGFITRRILEQLKDELTNLTQKELILKADEILRSVGSFDGIFEYLQRNGYDETNQLIREWKRIYLSLICTTICVSSDANNNNGRAMDGDFITNLYNRFQTFDKIEDLQWLINEIKTKLQATGNNLVETSDLLQYLYQIYVTDFAFTKQSVINAGGNEEYDNQRNEFLQALIDVCSQANKMDAAILDDDNKDNGDNEEDEEQNAIGLELNHSVNYKHCPRY